MLYGFGYLLFVVDLCLLYMCGWFVVCGFDGGYVMLFDVCCVQVDVCCVLWLNIDFLIVVMLFEFGVVVLLWGVGVGFGVCIVVMVVYVVEWCCCLVFGVNSVIVWWFLVVVLVGWL